MTCATQLHLEVTIYQAATVFNGMGAQDERSQPVERDAERIQTIAHSQQSYSEKASVQQLPPRDGSKG